MDDSEGARAFVQHNVVCDVVYLGREKDEDTGKSVLYGICQTKRAKRAGGMKEWLPQASFRRMEGSWESNKVALEEVCSYNVEKFGHEKEPAERGRKKSNWQKLMGERMDDMKAQQMWLKEIVYHLKHLVDPAYAIPVLRRQ